MTLLGAPLKRIDHSGTRKVAVFRKLMRRGLQIVEPRVKYIDIENKRRTTDGKRPLKRGDRPRWAEMCMLGPSISAEIASEFFANLTLCLNERNGNWGRTDAGRAWSAEISRLRPKEAPWVDYGSTPLMHAIIDPDQYGLLADALASEIVSSLRNRIANARRYKTRIAAPIKRYLISNAPRMAMYQRMHEELISRTKLGH